MPDRPVRNSAGKIAPGIDVRATGGYVLAPPSIHPSGRRYCWSVDSSNTLAAAPDWLLDKIADPINGARPVALPPSSWRELVLTGLEEGTRDVSFTRLAGYFLRRRLDAVLVLEILRSLNTTHCRPPLPDDGALLPGVDGRSTWIRRCKEIITSHLSDLGGADNTSAARALDHPARRGSHDRAGAARGQVCHCRPS